MYVHYIIFIKKKKIVNTILKFTDTFRDSQNLGLKGFEKL